MSVKVNLPGGSISMTNRTADRLIESSQGDCALLMLYLLRHNGDYYAKDAAAALKWEEKRVEEAFRFLQGLELISVPEDPAPVFPLDAKDAPVYSAEDLAELQKETYFSHLLEEIELQLGYPLTVSDTRSIAELYNYLGLSPAVIHILVTYVKEETEYRSAMKGQGAHPRIRVSDIRKTGYDWSNRNLNDLGEATAFLERSRYYRTREGGILRMAGIAGRMPSRQESNYIRRWLDWGFTDELISTAVDRTVTGAGKWNWNYCNAILKKWADKKITTLQQVQEQDRAAAAAQPAKPAPQRKKQGPTQEEIDAANEQAALSFMEYMRQQNGGGAK